jgi:hypothetical protein
MGQLSMIGLDAREVSWVRLLVQLLRNPDPVVGEVTREALRYLEEVAARAEESRAVG